MVCWASWCLSPPHSAICWAIEQPYFSKDTFRMVAWWWLEGAVVWSYGMMACMFPPNAPTKLGVGSEIHGVMIHRRETAMWASEDWMKSQCQPGFETKHGPYISLHNWSKETTQKHTSLPLTWFKVRSHFPGMAPTNQHISGWIKQLTYNEAVPGSRGEGRAGRGRTTRG